MSHILIDLDNTIADWTAGVRAYAYKNERLWVADKIRDTQWDLNPTGDPLVTSIIERAQRSPNFYAKLHPIEGAVEGVKALQLAGHQISFVSTPDLPNKTSHSDKAAWIMRHFEDEFPNSGEQWARLLILTHDKTMIQGDYLIDDKPHIFGRNVAHKPWHHIVFAQPYNHEQGVAYPAGALLRYWGSAVDVIEYLDSQRMETAA